MLQKRLHDAQMIIAGQYQSAIVEDDSGNTYICYARNPKAKLTDAVWQVARVDSDGSRQFAENTARFKFRADDPESLNFPSRS